MSLILDALRKMEQERKSRRGAAQDLRPEVLRYHSMGGRTQQPNRYPLVIIGLVLLSAGIGAGIVLKGNRAEVVSQASQASAPLPPAPAPGPAPTAAPAVSSPAPAALPVPVPALPAAVELPRPKPARTQAAPAPPRTAPVETGASSQAQPAYREAIEDPQHADISITGIAYQDERRMRRAVLNGVLVGEGAEIAGARVVEIRETKVRLSRGGRIFEVPFSSGLQSR